ncbi:50S ribosomal protein L5 [bacterium]|jgi:large subunit ribosomal protein L5|nr:50S ribosomal protein L5 [bacterium]MBT3581163.1 50S ribosomal protein L5 [bacterium]MBT4551596.1 50S ribosomal protein L5 [bacterium]MBT5988891.1 50S ribosomal protein L5 [bacterium]MBT7087802.1 50S ribosomal protein L5 [bacterium]
MSTRKKVYKEKAIKNLLEKYKYKSVMQVPKIEKIVLNRGIGEAISNSKVVDLTVEQFGNITGQKPVVTKAKKSISNFKLREGQPVGCMVTLRGKKMWDFLTKLIDIVFPRIRDFRGVPVKSFDKNGNYTLGLNDETVFPEVGFDRLDNKVRGMNITIVTTANSSKESYDLLKLIGMPFRKD